MHRPAGITHVLAPLGTTDFVEVLAAAPRLRLRSSYCQMTSMARQTTHATYGTEH